MSIKTRVIKYLQSSLPQSLGVVTRNYAKAPIFQPRNQVIGITYKAVDKIAQSLSIYEPIVLRPNGDAYENHPLLALFNKPNPKMTATDFIHLWAMLYEIYGETFWYKAPGEFTRKPKELWLLPPDQMEVKIEDGKLVGYVLHKTNGGQEPLLPEEVIHDKRPNPFNEWRGISVLERAAVYINTEIVVSNFTFNYMKNSASPSGIVSLPAMEPEAFKQFTQQWREGYEGPENAGKTAFIRGGEASFKAVGATLQDVDAKAIKDMSKEDVLMMLDVPKSLLGMTDEKGFGRGSVETLNFIFASEKLEPMMRRLDRIYEKLALELTGNQPVDITHESPIPEDKEFEHKQNKELVNVAITVNEVRARMGLQPIDGGDVIMPSNPAKMPVEVSQSKYKIVKKSVAKKLNDDQEAFRKNLVENNEVYAKKFKSKLSKFLSEQEAELISKLITSQKAFEEIMFSVKEDAEKMAEILIPIIIELMEAQGEDVANFITGELLTISPEIRATVEQNIKELSGVFDTDTIKALEKTLSEGQTAGESLTKLKKRVEEVYSDAEGYRAERIARTETLRSSNMTAEEVYKQNGYSKVEWFINPGACEFCQTYAGRSKEIGSSFTMAGDVITGTDGNQMVIDYSNIDYPPLHPNCTCLIVPA